MRACITCGSLNWDESQRCVICSSKSFRELDSEEFPDMRSVLLMAYMLNPDSLNNPHRLESIIHDIAPLLFNESLLMSAIKMIVSQISVAGIGQLSPSAIRNCLLNGRYPYPDEVVSDIEIAFEAVRRLALDKRGFIKEPWSYDGLPSESIDKEGEKNSKSQNLKNVPISLSQPAGIEVTKGNRRVINLEYSNARDNERHCNIAKEYLSFTNDDSTNRRGVDHLEIAASRFHPEANFLLGRIYYTGRFGIKRDYQVARERFEIAASSDDPIASEAMYYLGLSYIEGRPTPPDAKLAEEWLKRASEKNHAKAQYQLGLLYLEGAPGVSKNAIKAEKCFFNAKLNGYKKT